MKNITSVKLNLPAQNKTIKMATRSVCFSNKCRFADLYISGPLRIYNVSSAHDAARRVSIVVCVSCLCSVVQ